MNEIERRALNSDLLRSFLVIAESRNLTLAADRLGRTQSAISVQLRKLEEDLGVSLFHRHPKGMLLSPEGERLLPAARRALGELTRAAALFDTPLKGRLRVGIPDDYDDTILERTLADFSGRHPGVEVIAASGCTSGYPEKVARGDLDIAVASSPSDLDGELLSSERTLWACAKAYTPDPDQPVPLAILDRACWWREMPTKALQAEGRGWRVAYKGESFESLKAAIRAGFAIGIVPERSIDSRMRVLSPAEGFPDLPVSKRTILIAPEAPQELAAAMAGAFRGATRLPAS